MKKPVGLPKTVFSFKIWFYKEFCLKILVIGSGGREHALVWKLKKSESVSSIFWAPGNGGAENYAECVDFSGENIFTIKEFCLSSKVNLVVVGPEAPLNLGIVDELNKSGIKVFGPSKSAAQLECSKVFTKLFCQKHNIPSADCWIFEDSKKAFDFLKSKEVNYPLVFKADGLAAGKGVIISEDEKQAEEAITKIMVQKEFGEAGNKLIVEEFLRGEEASVMALCDGEKSLLLPTARDYKRALDGDKGLNTGGMGAMSPSPLFSEENGNNSLLKEIKAKIIDKTVSAMAESGSPFKGILYAGLMITEKGPKLLEFNVRFGDPETQVVLPRIEDDLFELLLSASEGNLSKKEIKQKEDKCVTVVAASKGYPSEYQKGFEITGLSLAQEAGAIVFHAGTKKKDGKIVTNGGRVLNITALGKSYLEARNKCYNALKFINFEGITFRSDIAKHD